MDPDQIQGDEGDGLPEVASRGFRLFLTIHQEKDAFHDECITHPPPLESSSSNCHLPQGTKKSRGQNMRGWACPSTKKRGKTTRPGAVA